MGKPASSSGNKAKAPPLENKAAAKPSISSKKCSSPSILKKPAASVTDSLLRASSPKVSSQKKPSASILKKPSTLGTDSLFRQHVSSSSAVQTSKEQATRLEKLLTRSLQLTFELACLLGLSTAQKLSILSRGMQHLLKNAKDVIVAAHPERLCVVGGGGIPHSNDHFSAEYFDPKKSEWIELPSMNVRRHGPLVCSAGGMVYAGGGEVHGPNGRKSWERLNPILGKWEMLTKMNEFRTESIPCTLGSYIYVCGNGYGTFGRNFDRLDLFTQVWEKMPGLRCGRADATAISWRGRVLVVGGVNQDSEVAMCESFDPEAKDWADEMILRTPRKGSACAVHDNNLYICGGTLEYCDSEDENFPGAVPLVERYSWEDEKWEVLPPMLQARYAAGAEFVGGFLYIVGGANAEGRLNTAERYCPSSNAWEPLPAMSTVRMRPGVAVVREVVPVHPSLPVTIPSTYSDHDETHSEREDEDDFSVGSCESLCQMCGREAAAEELGGVECWSCYREH